MDHEWVGMGIKEIADGNQMVNGDYVSVVLSTAEIADRHGVMNGNPKTDDAQGGTDDINEDANEPAVPGEEAIFTWNRLLLTGDLENDCQLVVGNTYYLQWAFGDMNGDMLVHHKHSGWAEITLSEEGTQKGVCDDSTSFLSLVN